jgi:hypothetical protein
LPKAWFFSPVLKIYLQGEFVTALLKVLRLFQLEPIDIEDIMKAAKKGEQVLIRLLRNLIPII